MKPTVSFVVPCYKLSHLLGDCIRSILSQTYADFEVLVLDDCSPDNTEAVARSFQDERIKYIRNTENLGHLRNYNQGITLSRGQYVWLVSADDRLTSCYALERYVSVMSAQVDIGFACCTGTEIRENNQLLSNDYYLQSKQPRIFSGPDFLARLLRSNFVIASSVMVRRSCYERFGAFPVDLPYAGDWYLWCLFALHYQVAYFSEAMVGYRIYGQSMTDSFIASGAATCASDDLAVLWRIYRKAEESHSGSVQRNCRTAIAYEYAQQLTGKRYRGYLRTMGVQEYAASLRRYTVHNSETEWFRTRVCESQGDLHFQRGDIEKALEFYGRALNRQFWQLKIWLKLLLLRAGVIGIWIRRSRAAFSSHI